MKEIEQIGHEDERMVLVFNAFDQIIPQLGIFSPITAKLRHELFGRIRRVDRMNRERSTSLIR
jgi:hypothetical protein